MLILFNLNENKQRIIYPIDVLSRAVERYDATHINQLKLSEDGQIIEIRNPLYVKNGYTAGRFGYEEDRPVKVSVTHSLEDKEVEVTSTGSMLEIIWKRNGKVIYDPQFPADKITEIKEYLEGLRFLLLTENLKTQVADFLAPYLQFLE